MLVPDLEIRGRGAGGGPPDPEISGGAFSKKFFSTLRVSVWSENKGGVQAPPLNPPLNDSSQGSLFQSVVTFGDETVQCDDC